jgi:hypothetical protein
LPRRSSVAALGGSGGAGQASPLGADILKRYRRIVREATTVAADDLAALTARARPKIGPGLKVPLDSQGVID